MASADPSPAFLDAFRQLAGTGGVLSFAQFMDLALYHPAVGYYTRCRPRIGRSPGSDFFTAESLGPVFAEIVVESCATLVGPQPAGDFTFVEIGAESARAAPGKPGGILAPPGTGRPGVIHPFAATALITLGQPLEFPRRAIVFSNELFDAQPCHRLIWESTGWRETGVALKGGRIEETLLPGLTPEVRAVAGRLPNAAHRGCRLDLPLAAERLAAQIAAQPWTGLFVACDYGKSWRDLAEDTPAGTVRAYSRHTQSNALLAQPGEQDLTCHVCWDWIAQALTAHGFSTPELESQEAFFVHHAAPALSRLAAAEAGRFSRRKLEVMQLLHPGNMGQKFQVLWARRGIDHAKT